MAASTFVKEGSPSQSVETITSSLAGIDLDGLTNSGLVDTPEAVSALVDVLHGLPVSPPSLYIDIEGVNLSRQGTISILQVFVRPKSRTYLVDIHILGNKAFATPGANGGTLKQILESETIPKVFFDVRNDSDALYSHFHIRLSGIQDLQLMELATRTFRRSHVNGLAKCIARDAPMGDKELVDWETTKENGIKLFQPNLGGSYEVFNERPLSEEIRTYCVQDVQFLPRLWTYYDAKITPRWRQRMLGASKERVTLSQAPEYNGQGMHMALAPQGWASLR